MTLREQRLRERIDTLSDERDRLRAEAIVFRWQLKRAYGRTTAARALARMWRVRALGKPGPVRVNCQATSGRTRTRLAIQLDREEAA